MLLTRLGHMYEQGSHPERELPGETSSPRPANTGDQASPGLLLDAA